MLNEIPFLCDLCYIISASINPVVTAKVIQKKPYLVNLLFGMFSQILRN